VGYAKLACFKGIEVTVNSLLVSKELLPINLGKYEDIDAFLKDAF